MKFKAHVPVEQFGFIEAETDSVDEVIGVYRDIQVMFSPGKGLPHKQWCVWLDGYLNGKPGSVDEWSQMDATQKATIQEIKKAFKRIKSK